MPLGPLHVCYNEAFRGLFGMNLSKPAPGTVRIIRSGVRQSTAGHQEANREAPGGETAYARLPAHLLTGFPTRQLLGRVLNRGPSIGGQHVQHIRAVYATHFEPSLIEYPDGDESFHVAQSSLPVGEIVQYGSEPAVAQFDSCALLYFCDIGVFHHDVI